jgi:hypothetical protein
MPIVEQCVGFDQVGRVEAFGEPLVDRREEVAARSSSDFACWLRAVSG